MKLLVLPFYCKLHFEASTNKSRRRGGRRRIVLESKNKNWLQCCSTIFLILFVYFLELNNKSERDLFLWQFAIAMVNREYSQGMCKTFAKWWHEKDLWTMSYGMYKRTFNIKWCGQFITLREIFPLLSLFWWKENLNF